MALALKLVRTLPWMSVSVYVVLLPSVQPIKRFGQAVIAGCATQGTRPSAVYLLQLRRIRRQRGGSACADGAFEHTIARRIVDVPFLLQKPAICLACMFLDESQFRLMGRIATSRPDPRSRTLVIFFHYAQHEPPKSLTALRVGMGLWRFAEGKRLAHRH